MAANDRKVWISYGMDEQGYTNVTYHTSEIKALRKATTTGGRAISLKAEQTLEDAITGVSADRANGLRMDGEQELPIEEDTPGVPAKVAEDSVKTKGRAVRDQPQA